jgi:hypothetical protein
MLGERSRFAILSLVALFCCDKSVAATPIHIDHVMIGTSDLNAGMAELERMTGVEPVFGGVHPGRGTRNALMSIGPHTYLELYAPNPDDPTSTEDVASLKTLRKLTPIGWAVSSDNMTWLRKRAAASGLQLTAPEAGSRRQSNGTVLHWSTFGYATFEDPLAPFFIHWEDERLHPSRTSPGGCRLLSLRISDPAAEKIRRAINPLGVHVRFRKATFRRMVVRLRCPRGTVTIG